MDVPPPPAGDPLGQPVRARLFALLGERAAPATTEELSAAVGRHPNGVRAHLERLRAAGLVDRRRRRHGRGRPRDEWSVAPGAQPRGRPPESYRALARWLARVEPATAAALARIERTGRELGRELVAGQGTAPPPAAAPGPSPAPAPAPEAAERMLAALAALGFAPDMAAAAPDRVAFCLGNCPFREAARERPDVVCTLHRGVSAGLLDALAPGARLEAFVARDPDAAGCLIEVGGLGAPAGAR